MTDPDAQCDASAARKAGPGAQPDFAAAAKTLGVSEDPLMRALGTPPPDIEAAAQTLGVSSDALQQALGR